MNTIIYNKLIFKQQDYTNPPQQILSRNLETLFQHMQTKQYIIIIIICTTTVSNAYLLLNYLQHQLILHYTFIKKQIILAFPYTQPKQSHLSLEKIATKQIQIYTRYYWLKFWSKKIPNYIFNFGVNQTIYFQNESFQLRSQLIFNQRHEFSILLANVITNIVFLLKNKTKILINLTKTLLKWIFSKIKIGKKSIIQKSAAFVISFISQILNKNLQKKPFQMLCHSFGSFLVVYVFFLNWQKLAIKKDFLGNFAIEQNVSQANPL
eukprot:TRINITY_DN19594_c1_g1_i1.p1 TRINITY_DN19594_c1_g1~~TRINITY_DN19594_c1_g1_i1.p1  ORF type:complete len:265 (-),score=-3.48 TRINITY_DN19594_c1_g1_i1:244-1038(-)